MKQHQLGLALSAAFILSACGGGDDEASQPVVPPTTTVTSTHFDVSGIAAKGLLANAIVRVHPVKDDGQPDLSIVLKETVTDQDGRYTLSIPTQPGRLYVVRISAKDDGSTTQKDEITGQAQALPAGFALRAVIQAESSVTKTDLNITPFTEMATAAAIKASGGLTKANKDQAQSNLVQMLGFDPSKVKPTDISAASTDEEKKLAIMLTSVAQLAREGALGCADKTQSGDKIKCVVEKLAEASKPDSTKPGSVGGVDVAAKLVEAVNKVVTTPELNKGKVDDSLVNVALGNLKGDGTPAPVSSATDVAAAKKLFDELRTSASSVLRPDAGATLSALDKEAERFGAALEEVQDPVTMLVRTSSAMVSGIQGMIQFGQGLGPNAGGGFYGGVDGGPSQLNAVGCTVYKDEARDVVATAPADGKFLGCSARYALKLINDPAQANKLVLAYTRHRLFITPGANAGEYSYSARAQLVVCKSTSFCSASDAFKSYNAQTSPATDFSGSIKIGLEQDKIKSFEINGDLPAMFKDFMPAINTPADTLYNPAGKANLTLKGSRNVILAATAKKGDLETVNLEGKITVFKDGGSTVDSEISLLTGSQLVNRVVADGSVAREPAAFEINLVAGTPKAQMDGKLRIGGISGSMSKPTDMQLNGNLRNKNADGSLGLSFFSGAVTAKLSGYELFDEAKPKSATNNYKGTLTLEGALTAEQRPQLKLNLSLSSSAWTGANDAKLDGQYKVLNKDKVETLVIALTASQNATTGKAGFKLSEATSGLNFLTDGEQSLIDLKKGEVKIGVIDVRNGRITFTNGEFWSLQ